ncbi:hypothetical protein Droror1_Dr00028320, partial [Drosera rotundifolia]
MQVLHQTQVVVSCCQALMGHLTIHVVDSPHSPGNNDEILRVALDRWSGNSPGRA